MSKNEHVLNLKNETDLSGFYLYYKGSTLNERPGIRGISHLMEHLMCKNIMEFVEEFDENGIAWNAGTASNYILFYFTGLEENIALYRDKIVSKLSQFNVTEKEFLNEKKIVIEEYKDAFNDQYESHEMNLYRKLFNDYQPIGELSDLESLTFQDCKDFFEVQYKHPNKIINVSKTFEFTTDIKFADFDEKLNKSITMDINNKNYIYQKSNEFKDKTSIIYLSDIIHENFAAIKFACAMLGSGLKSPLYTEIREKRGLVYYIRCNINDLNDKHGIININAITSNKNKEEFINTLDDVLSHPEKFLTEARFNVIKNKYIIQYKKNRINRYGSIDAYITDPEWNLEQYVEMLTLDDIKAVYNKYFKNFYKSIDKEEF